MGDFDFCCLICVMLPPAGICTLYELVHCITTEDTKGNSSGNCKCQFQELIPDLFSSTQASHYLTSIHQGQPTT